MGIEDVQIPEAEQVKRTVTPDEQQKLDRFDRALNIGCGMIKKWLKEKKGIEFTVEQEDEFFKMYQASFALSSLIM